MRRPGGRLAALFLVAAMLATTAAAAAEWVYSFVDGDNLWDFSSRYLDSPLRYEALRRINNVERPRHMPPGTRIRVPMQWIRSNPVTATLAETVGRVELIRADGSRVVDPPAGTQVGLGDTLITGADARAAVRFADHTTTTLHQNGEMRFDHLSAHGDTGMVDSRLRLQGGRIETQVTPATGPGSRFEIHTPSAVSAVRGTDYRAAVAGDGGTVFEVTGGRVLVSGAGESQLLRRGFGTTVATDTAPAAPRALLAAPRVLPVPNPVRLLNQALVWEPVPGAAAYRIEIGSAESSRVRAWERVVQRDRATLPDLPDGRYRIAVRAIDADGIEGFDRVLDVDFDTRPRAPVPLQPVDGAVLRGTIAELRWSASADAARYRLEVATSPAFDGTLMVEDLTEPHLRAAAAEQPGDYYWRISSIAADGEVGPPSDVRHWVSKPQPETVAADVSGDADGVVASWRDVGGGARYQVQIADDLAFEHVEDDRVVDAPRMAFDAVSGQVRFLRVRVIEADGYAGSWGAVQRIDPLPDPTAWVVPVLGILGVLLL